MPTDQCLEGHGYSPGQGASPQGAAPTLRCHSADACLGGTRRVSKRWFLCLSYNNRLHAQVILIQIGDCRWPRFWRQLDLCEICATSRRTSYVSRSSASKVTFAGSCDHSSLDRTELCAKEENVTDGSLAPRSRLQRSGLSSAQRGSPAKGLIVCQPCKREAVGSLKFSVLVLTKAEASKFFKVTATAANTNSGSTASTSMSCQFMDGIYLQLASSTLYTTLYTIMSVDAWYRVLCRELKKLTVV